MDHKKNKNVAVVANLPDSLIIDIFTKLPVKSLCRFKCLSKFYLSSIQDPSFVVDNLRPKAPVLWQLEYDRDLYVYSIDCSGSSTLKHTYRFQDYVTRLQYSNGLNCFFDRQKDLHVLNTATKECITLPRWCDDCVFCFDPSSRKHKVLGCQKKSGEPFDFRVLTLESVPWWKPVTNTLELDDMLELDAFSSGEAFWKLVEEGKIISFNFAKEEFRAICLPDEIGQGTLDYHIFEFEGSLSLVEELHEEPAFNLWILKDINNCNVWVMMKKIIMLPLGGIKRHECYMGQDMEGNWLVSDFEFSSLGGELVVTITTDFDYQFVFSYSFLNNQFKMMKITGLPYFGFRAGNYVESYIGLQEFV